MKNFIFILCIILCGLSYSAVDPIDETATTNAAKVINFKSCESCKEYDDCCALIDKQEIKNFRDWYYFLERNINIYSMNDTTPHPQPYSCFAGNVLRYGQDTGENKITVCLGSGYVYEVSCTQNNILSVRMYYTESAMICPR